MMAAAAARRSRRRARRRCGPNRRAPGRGAAPGRRPADRHLPGLARQQIRRPGNASNLSEFDFAGGGRVHSDPFPLPRPCVSHFSDRLPNQRFCRSDLRKLGLSRGGVGRAAEAVDSLNALSCSAPAQILRATTSPRTCDCSSAICSIQSDRFSGGVWSLSGGLELSWLLRGGAKVEGHAQP